MSCAGKRILELTDDRLEIAVIIRMFLWFITELVLTIPVLNNSTISDEIEQMETMLYAITTGDSCTVLVILL